MVYFQDNNGIRHKLTYIRFGSRIYQFYFQPNGDVILMENG